MKNKLKILFIVIIIIIILIFAYNIAETKREKEKEEINANRDEVMQEYFESKVIKTENNVCILGNVEIKNSGSIYIFIGQHFGEYGYEIPEYTSAIIKNKKQKCMDYFTLEMYDTDYIEEGDLLILTGDLNIKEVGEKELDTKDNAIVVLKADDYNKMKRKSLSSENSLISQASIGEIFKDKENNIEEIYVYYHLEDNTNSDTGYIIPFVVRATVTENTQIIGNLEKGKNIKITYENAEVPFDDLIIKSIENE